MSPAQTNAKLIAFEIATVPNIAPGHLGAEDRQLARGPPPRLLALQSPPGLMKEPGQCRQSRRLMCKMAHLSEKLRCHQLAVQESDARHPERSANGSRPCDQPKVRSWPGH